MSLPHFYQTEEKFVEAVIGMKPNKEQHQTTIDINPVGKSERSLTSSAFVLYFLVTTRRRCGAAFQS